MGFVVARADLAWAYLVLSSSILATNRVGNTLRIQTLTIKAPEIRSSRRGITTQAIPSTPGEWEKYREEELGMEEVK